MHKRRPAQISYKSRSKNKNKILQAINFLAFINKRQQNHLHINNSQLLSHFRKTQHAIARIYAYGRRNDDKINK
jgi:hypothetical protein